MTQTDVVVAAPKNSINWKRIFCYLLGMALFTIVYVAPPWPDAVDPMGKAFQLTREGKGALIGFVSPDLVAEGMSAAEILRAGATVLGGGGSRDPELAQAGGPQGDRIEEALEAVREAGRSALLAR